MIYGLATVFAIYSSVRLYENYRKTAKGSSSNKRNKEITSSSPLKNTLGNILIKSDENNKNKHYLAMSGVSIVLSSARYFYPPLRLASILVFTYTAIPYLRQAEKSLLIDRKVDGYVLYSVADLMMLGLGAYASASVGVGLLHTSKYILSNAKEQTKKQMVDIFSHQSDMVWVLKNNKEVQVPIEQLKKNDILIVNAGDIIPVDGLVIDGIAAVDQQVLTGESQPTDKGTGDRVFASTMVISGHVSIQMEKSGQETIVAKIAETINHSIEFKGSQALKGEKWADSFTLPTLILAFTSWPFLGPVGVVGILYCHIANSIRVVAPLGTLNYLNIAMKNGILVKDGHALEELTHIDTVIFDKTGTLTQEIPEIGQIILCDESYSEDDILFYAATAEQKSVHPIAKAIHKKAEENKLILPQIEDSSYDIGYGISVDIDGKNINIGSKRFMKMKNVKIPETFNKKMDEALAIGHSVIMLAVDSILRGILVIHITVRPETAQTIRNLRQNGIEYMAIVSGDHELPTKALADSLKIDNYYHSILPEEKAKIVEELQQQGKKVAFIGDGVNDTIAMEKADVSISLSGASSVATDLAKVVLMDGNLLHVPYLFELSRKLDKNLSRSLVLNIVPNVIALNGVLFFHFGMLTTMLVSQSPLVLGTLNALFPVDSESVHSIDDNNMDDHLIADSTDSAEMSPNTLQSMS